MTPIKWPLWPIVLQRTKTKVVVALKTAAITIKNRNYSNIKGYLNYPTYNEDIKRVFE